MKKKLSSILTALIMSMSYVDFAWATETIKIYSPYTVSHSGTSALRQIIDQANSSQSIYKFILEFRPGGQQIIAVKSMETETGLAVIAPAFVEAVASGQLNQQNYRPVFALGDACWAVVTNKPLRGSQEFVVGGVGFGNAAHLTALALGEKYGFNVRYVIFKSNNDALVNMAGNHGVEFVIDRYESYSALRTKNSKLQMVAASCPSRLPQEPKIKTLKELGIQSPYIFNIIVAHKDMPSARRQAIASIMDSAMLSIGAEEIYRLSAVRPPVFDNIPTQTFFDHSIGLVKSMQEKYKDKIVPERSN